jgi:hypothetical protein
LTPQDISFVQPPESLPFRAMVIGLPEIAKHAPFVPFFDQHMVRFLMRLRIQLPRPSGELSDLTSDTTAGLAFVDVVSNKKTNDHALSFVYVSVIEDHQQSQSQQLPLPPPLSVQQQQQVLANVERCDLRFFGTAPLSDSNAIAQFCAKRAWDQLTMRGGIDQPQ